MIVRFPEFVGRWFTSSQDHGVLKLWSLVTAISHKTWSYNFPSSLVDGSRVHEITEFWSSGYSLQQQVGDSRFAWRGAFDSCFILAGFTGICTSGSCYSGFLLQLRSWRIRQFGLWNIHCICVLSGFYNFILALLYSTAVVTHPQIFSLKYPLHLCFVWILRFTSL